MKTVQLLIQPGRAGLKKSRWRSSLPLARRDVALSPSRTERNRIQWPTNREIRRVSTILAKVSRTGMRREVAGDYFTSGDLAYQLQEIMRATGELFKKTRRFKN